MTLKTVTGSAVGTPDSLALREILTDYETQDGPRYATLGVPLSYIPVKSPDRHSVACGDNIFFLSHSQFMLWMALQVPQSETEIQELLASGINGLVDSGPLADEWSALQELRLVVQLPGDQSDIFDWNEVSLVAQGFGLGEDLEMPGAFLVGLQNGEVAARVNLAGYLFWAFCDNRRSVPEIVELVCGALSVSQDHGLQLLDIPLLLRGLLQSGALRLNWLNA